MAEYSIGELARAANTRVQTIRWYEQKGLLPPAPRTAGGQRRYDEAMKRRLMFIRHARELGFPLDDIRELLQLQDNPGAPCAEAHEIALRQLDETRRKIARLQSLEQELAHMLCRKPRGTVGTCRVIEVLSDHGQCLNARH